jgi:hypothetical protein
MKFETCLGRAVLQNATTAKKWTPSVAIDGPDKVPERVIKPLIRSDSGGFWDSPNHLRL